MRKPAEVCCECRQSHVIAYDVNRAAKKLDVDPKLLRAHIWHDLLSAKYPTSRPVIKLTELNHWYDSYVDVIKPYLEATDRPIGATATSEAIHIFFLVNSWSMNQREKTCCDCHSVQKLAYTFEEAGDAIGVSSATIRRLVRDSYLIAKYPTSRPVIQVDDLVAFLESCPDEPPNR